MIELAYSVALEEVKDSAKPFEQAKTRAAILFGSVSAAMSFLVGSALQSLDRSTFDYLWVGIGTGAYIGFALCVLALLFPWNRHSWFDALGVRNMFILGNQPEDAFRPEQAYDVIQVKWSMISIAHSIVAANAKSLNWLRAAFIGALVFATIAIASWSWVVTFATPIKKV